MITKFILFLSFVLSFSAFSADSKDAPKKVKETYAGIAVADPQDETLKKLMAIPEVKAKYEDCKSRKSLSIDEVPDCMWKELPDNLKKQIQASYAEGKTKGETNRAPSSVDVPANKDRPTTNLTKRDYSIGIDYKSDPTVKALSDFYGKKLDEVLSGKDMAKDPKEKNMIAAIDHKKFIDLYTSELGKSIVNSFTAYCMETEPDCRKNKTNCYIKKDQKDRDADIKKNLEAVNNATFSKEEGDEWTHCISTIPKICYDNNSKGSNEEYSKTRACTIMDFVKAARKGLIAADEQKEFYEKLHKGGGVAQNMKVLDADKKASADNLTMITSSDIDKETKDENNKATSIAKVNDETLKEADKCYNNGQVDEKKCGKFIDTEKDKNEQAFAEFGLRKLAQEDVLQEKLKDDKNVESYLKEEGYTSDQIAEMINNKASLEEVRKKIQDRYKSEREALIKTMADKLQAKDSKENGKITNEDKDKMITIKDELTTRSEDLKQLIHFNNVVASYLGTTDKNDKTKTGRNTASLFAEMKELKGPDAEKFKKNVEKNKLKDDQTNVFFGIKELNDFFLKYIDKKN